MKPFEYKFELLIEQLHKRGLSDLAKHLEIYLQFATDMQIKSLYDSLLAYMYKMAETNGG